MALRMWLIAASLLVCILPGNADYEPFTAEEFTDRLQRAQQKMKEQGLGALLLTMEVHHFYFTGVKSEFWQSPTRPYYLVIPRIGGMIAVVPSISGSLYEENVELIDAVHTWPAPVPEDDGISLLEEALRQALKKSDAGNVIGTELGWEFQLRMPVSDFNRLSKLMEEGGASFTDATLLLKRLRAVKSDAEIALMRKNCQAQSAVMSSIPVHAGMTEKEAARTARTELTKAGADRVPYVACRSGMGGYEDIVGSASNRVLEDGDVLIIDTGSVLDGYFCDFNRNWHIGELTASPMTEELTKIQAALYRAVDAGIREARPGRTTADIFHAMAAELPATGSSVGRMGHGVGLAITEWPSILPGEAGQNVTLEAGMVLAIEPSAGFGSGNQFLVHEEDVVVSEGGGVILSVRGPRVLPTLPGKFAAGKKVLGDTSLFTPVCSGQNITSSCNITS
mmetsp:Transcript_32860/g.60346  ORF Transcript_32860/g.60346 Transcript_32860/m.60346 type:complete len:451 (+) Transcript_32860:59-1411(+)